nr:hypothetical protein [Streptomyces avermitilis]
MDAPVLAQEILTSGSRRSMSKDAGSTGTEPFALPSPSRVSRVVGAVCTSVPSSAPPITLVTSARSPSGAPGAGALAMTSPTAMSPGAVVPPALGVDPPLGVVPVLGVEVALLARDMTARRVLLSYELTLSAVLCARPPAAPEWATAVGVASAAGAAATASERSASAVAAPVAAAPEARPADEGEP